MGITSSVDTTLTPLVPELKAVDSMMCVFHGRKSGYPTNSLLVARSITTSVK